MKLWVYHFCILFFKGEYCDGMSEDIIHNDNVNVGIKIKKLRMLRRLSQEQLADGIFVSRSCISNYERNARRPNVEILQTLSSYFKVSIGYFTNNAIGSSKNEIIDLLNKSDCLDISEFSIEDKIKLVQLYNELAKKYNKSIDKT